MRDDAELTEHLRSCPVCARRAEATDALRRAFVSLSDNDCDEAPSLAQVRRQVEAEAFAANRGYRRITNAMSTFWNPLSGRARWGLGVGVAVAMLALITLVPFSYQRTVGYEVAFAGVDKDLAMDPNKIDILLAKLGVDGATVALGGCEATCSLTISDVRSKDQCRMIVYAMKEIGDVCVISEGTELREKASGAIVELVGYNVFVSDDASDQYAIQNRVMECLGEDFSGKTNIWIGECDVSAAAAGDHRCAPGAVPFGKACCDSGAVPCSVTIDLAMGSCGDGDGKSPWILIMRDSEFPNKPWGTLLQEAGIDPAALHGDIDEATRQKLADLGIAVEYRVQSGEGQIQEPPEEQFDEAAKAIVPDGYVLDQNYPNPFNPQTTIGFTLARSERVRIDIVNVLGRTVRTLVNEYVSAGKHSVGWDATDDAGTRVPSGIYLYRIQAGDFVQTKSMTLLK
jgi:hypothetical protein